jgi:hypothetical protein
MRTENENTPRVNSTTITAIMAKKNMVTTKSGILETYFIMTRQFIQRSRSMYARLKNKIGTQRIANHMIVIINVLRHKVDKNSEILGFSLNGIKMWSFFSFIICQLSVFPHKKSIGAANYGY